MAAEHGRPDTRIALGSALAADGDYRAALDELFAAMDKATGATRDQARQAILDVFSVLGDQDELTTEYRPRLAALLW